MSRWFDDLLNFRVTSRFSNTNGPSTRTSIFSRMCCKCSVFARDVIRFSYMKPVKSQMFFLGNLFLTVSIIYLTSFVEKAAEGGHNDQIAGTDASATPIDLPEVAPGETPYTTRSDLLAIPRNNYTVHVQADPGWYVSEVLVDGVAQDLGEGFPRIFDVPFENVTADHVVKSKFERYGYVTIGKRFDDGSSPVIVQPTHPYS